MKGKNDGRIQPIRDLEFGDRICGIEDHFEALIKVRFKKSDVLRFS